MKLFETLCVLAIASILTGCDQYYKPPPQPRPPGAPVTASSRKAFDIRGMKTEFTKLDVGVWHKGKRLCSGKVEDEQLVLAFNHDPYTRGKEFIVEISRDGKTLLKKDWDSVNGSDIRNLDLKSP